MTRRQTSAPQVSVIIPAHNEAENILPLTRELVETLDRGPLSWEAILVNDGSTDPSQARIADAIAHDDRLSAIHLPRRLGQTAALSAGIHEARGRTIVPMDADLQNDPRDIALLVQALGKPPFPDVVSGWRRSRQDKMLSRRLPSILANQLTARVSGVRIHDFGCTITAYRAEPIKKIHLFGETHRLLPAVCAAHGAVVTEQVVNHRARRRGRSKYGFARVIPFARDLSILFVLRITRSRTSRHGRLATHALVALGAAAVAKVLGLSRGPRPAPLSGIIATGILATALIFILSSFAVSIVQPIAERAAQRPAQPGAGRTSRSRRAHAGDQDL